MTEKKEHGYIHGYTPEEQERLLTQSRFLEPMIYKRVDLTGVKSLLEIGCGVGAQLKILARRYPDMQLTGIDRSEAQLAKAATLLAPEIAAGRVKLVQARGETSSLPAASFDGVFICWLLEHVPDPTAVLAEARRVLRPQGVLYATEVFLATLYVEPTSPTISEYWRRFTAYQVELGGHPMIGARLGGLLVDSGFANVDLWPMAVHLDGRAKDPKERQSHIRYWHELFLSAAPGLQAAGKVDAAMLAGLDREFKLLASDPQSIFYVEAMQARVN